MAAKDASLTVRLPSDLKEALEAAAKREDRSTSKLVEIILRDWIATDLCSKHTYASGDRGRR